MHHSLKLILCLLLISFLRETCQSLVSGSKASCLESENGTFVDVKISRSITVQCLCMNDVVENCRWQSPKCQRNLKSCYYAHQSSNTQTDRSESTSTHYQSSDVFTRSRSAMWCPVVCLGCTDSKGRTFRNKQIWFDEGVRYECLSGVITKLNSIKTSRDCRKMTCPVLPCPESKYVYSRKKSECGGCPRCRRLATKKRLNQIVNIEKDSTKCFFKDEILELNQNLMINVSSSLNIMKTKKENVENDSSSFTFTCYKCRCERNNTVFCEETVGQHCLKERVEVNSDNHQTISGASNRKLVKSFETQSATFLNNPKRSKIMPSLIPFHQTKRSHRSMKPRQESTESGICTVFGDPHYKTYDGRIFNFQGSCKYLLTTQCKPFESSDDESKRVYSKTGKRLKKKYNKRFERRSQQQQRNNGKYIEKNSPFSIRVTNDARASMSYAWLRSVNVKMVDERGKRLKINLMQRMKVRVNGKRVNLPYIRLGSLSIIKDGYRIVMRTTSGIRIIWDGVSYLEVKIPPQYANKMCGLCGNFNGDASDDLPTPNHSTGDDSRQLELVSGGKRERNTLMTVKHEEKMPPNFGDKWRVGGPSTCSVLPKDMPVYSKQPTCTQNWSSRIYSDRACNAIFAPSLFSECLGVSLLDKLYYQEACKMDTCQCGDNDKCHCEVLTALARQCERSGTLVQGWRDVTGCDDTQQFKFDRQHFGLSQRNSGFSGEIKKPAELNKLKSSKQLNEAELSKSSSDDQHENDNSTNPYENTETSVLRSKKNEYTTPTTRHESKNVFIMSFPMRVDVEPSTYMPSKDVTRFGLLTDTQLQIEKQKRLAKLRKLLSTPTRTHKEVRRTRREHRRKTFSPMKLREVSVESQNIGSKSSIIKSQMSKTSSDIENKRIRLLEKIRKLRSLRESRMKRESTLPNHRAKQSVKKLETTRMSEEQYHRQ